MQLVAELALALAHHGADHRVQAGAVAAAGEHGDPHRGLLERRRSDRPSADLDPASSWSTARPTGCVASPP